jgi:LysM repeat protein
MKVILFLLLFTFSLQAYAQQTKLYAAKNERGTYIEHKVQPKENWYSVGRAYAISPKEIASFNGLSMDKGLSIGQALKVPLNASNFIQTVSSEGVPVYHTVQPKEGLLKVATIYGMSLTSIKAINGLNTDQVNIGYQLVVGYIGAANQNATPSVPPPSTSNTNPPKSTAPASTVTTALPASTPVATVNPTPQKTQTATPPVTPKSTVITEKPKEEAPKVAPKTVEKVNQPKVQAAENKMTPPGLKNYFATEFLQQSKDGKEQKVDNPTYGIFKSSSGWQDGKYYILMNDVVPGTIVKLTDIKTEYTVHAKVLGAVPPGKESEGMQLRLSNAAASALGMPEGEIRSLVVVWYK